MAHVMNSHPVGRDKRKHHGAQDGISINRHIDSKHVEGVSTKRRNSIALSDLAGLDIGEDGAEEPAIRSRNLSEVRSFTV